MCSGLEVPVTTLATSMALTSGFFLEYKVKYAIDITMARPPTAALAGQNGILRVWLSTSVFMLPGEGNFGDVWFPVAAAVAAMETCCPIDGGGAAIPGALMEVWGCPGGGAALTPADFMFSCPTISFCFE